MAKYPQFVFFPKYLDKFLMVSLYELTPFREQIKWLVFTDGYIFRGTMHNSWTNKYVPSRKTVSLFNSPLAKKSCITQFTNTDDINQVVFTNLIVGGEGETPNNRE